MMSALKIVLVYIYAEGGRNGYRDKAMRFVESYLKHPPEADHETVVVCNGVPVTPDARSLFARMPNCTFLNHDDSGWDIGGYQLAAMNVDCDLMLFCGGHTYFRRQGWLKRIVEVWEDHGVALYGATGNQGNGNGVHPHVRTTAFWCHPKLMNWYPYRVVQPGGGGQRYEMEHGQTCLSNWFKQQGLKRYIVTFSGVYPLERCDSGVGGYHNGNQENLLIGDRLTCPPFHPVP
jgi:hypothetical protein